MAGKNNAGFTKAAQKKKFVRNRDIKLKGSEERKEQRIQHLMCEGICAKCRDIVQWRFQYDKYKPLKNPATCQECHNKTVYKAYRTICDACAAPRKRCSSCCGDINAGRETSAAVSAATSMAIETSTVVDDGRSIAAGATSATAAEGDEEDSSDIEVDGVSDHDIAAASASDLGTEVPELAESVGTGIWDSRKFHSLAAQKYSKSRVVGSEEDAALAYGSLA